MEKAIEKKVEKIEKVRKVKRVKRVPKKGVKKTKNKAPAKQIEIMSNSFAKKMKHLGVENRKEGKLGGRKQHRFIGERKKANKYGHYEGSIGAKIDELLEKGRYTKKQIEIIACTKMSKVNSHINHLRKECGVEVVTPRNGICYIPEKVIEEFRKNPRETKRMKKQREKKRVDKRQKKEKKG